MAAPSSSSPATVACRRRRRCYGGILFSSVSVVLLFFFCSPAASHGQKTTVPAMYVFGDSLVDVGNNHYRPLCLLRADFPHNGVDYPGGEATGRFSNGKNAADFLAEKLSLQSPPPYLSLPSDSDDIVNADAFLKGVSFASGGAGILNTTHEIQSLTLDEQIDLFARVYATLVQKLGIAATQKHLSHSIVAVVIGSNDFLGYFRSDPSQRPMPPKQFVDSLLSTLRGQLRRIYNLGARKMVFVGTAPIGCSPRMRLLNATRGCAAEANQGAAVFNGGADSLLKGMASELGDMSYSFVDTYAVLEEIIRKPTAYGFAEAQSACCGLGDLNAKLPCIPISRYCDNRRDHVFWDFYHPTEAAASLFADTFFNGSRPYVYPINVRELAAL